MDQETFNITIRKFLKHFGVTAQREIEQAVQRAMDEGRLTGTESLPVSATLRLGHDMHEVTIDGTIALE